MRLEQWNNPPYKPKSNGDTLSEKTICLGTVNSQKIAEITTDKMAKTRYEMKEMKTKEKR
jgi:hypothetical protein